MSAWTWKRYPACDDRMFARFSQWPTQGSLAGAETLKTGSVWRLDDVVIKRGRLHRLRRSAAAWAWLRPIASPEPLLLGSGTTDAVLVMRNCPGVTLAQAWDDPAARNAMADLIAELYGRRIVHGDLSPRNILWDGERAWLIDLDGLRNPLHRLFWQRHLRMTWAWLYHRLPHPSLVRFAFERCNRALGLPVTEQRWQRLLAEVRLIERDYPGAKGESVRSSDLLG